MYPGFYESQRKEEGKDLLHSCSMVAHSSNFFQVCAKSSFEVLTASKSRPMLSCRDNYKQRSIYDTAKRPKYHYSPLEPVAQLVCKRRKAEGCKCGLTLRGMTSLVTRKRSKWKSETMPRNAVEVHWDRYVDKLWKFCNRHKRKTCLESWSTVTTIN